MIFYMNGLRGDFMFDFVEVAIKDISTVRNPGVVEISPNFKNIKSKDLMIKGKDFYAFWDEERGLWNKDEYALIEAIDKIVHKAADEFKGRDNITVNKVIVKTLSDDTTKCYTNYCKYKKNLPDNWKQLDKKVIFAGTKTKKSDYASFTLGYSLDDCDISAYDELISTLYEPKERKKIEWAIGSIIAGDSIDIQKFYVLYGSAGTGKSTILDIIELLFEGYHKSFKSEELGKTSATFSMEALKDNPLVAIDHEGKLDKIDNNTILNSIVSHDNLVINVKFAAKYEMRFNTTMFIGSNSPVKITDSKSGLIRRLIDISPTGNIIPYKRYVELMDKVQFELSGIAKHCLEIYLKAGKNYYGNYKPTGMIAETNDMYNFVSEMLWDWEETKEVTLAKAWQDYIKWCDESKMYPMKKNMFKSELMEYFEDFHLRKGPFANVFIGIKYDKLGYKESVNKRDDHVTSWLDFKEQKSVFDDICKDCYAQYATEEEIPGRSWKSVTSRLRELDTSRLHYVKVPENHIVIDFDIKNDKGEKDYILNMQAASKFPKTYAELSKGGEGIHLHYIYTGDVSKLSRIYDADIEVKVFRGGASLRRKLTKCNDISITSIGSGLPLKEEKAVVDNKTIENERHLIALLKKCLNKEHHGHTAPEVDFMKHLTDKAYATEGLSYDIRPMKPAIVSFAMESTNQAQKCFDTVSQIHYCSKDIEENEVLYSEKVGDDKWQESPIVFFDIEIFPNLFVVCWKILGSNNINRMINPSPKEVEELFKYRLVGFNCKRYDNHIIYARSMGYSIEELFKLSTRLIAGSDRGFSTARQLSYTDIWDYALNKQSLKAWEIDLGIFHLENSRPWNKPVDEKYWNEIADYCCNDVIATEATWEATKTDFKAREILADLSGGSVNDSTNALVIKLIFGDEKHPKLIYTDLATGERYG